MGDGLDSNQFDKQVQQQVRLLHTDLIKHNNVQWEEETDQESMCNNMRLAACINCVYKLCNGLCFRSSVYVYQGMIITQGYFPTFGTEIKQDISPKSQAH